MSLWVSSRLVCNRLVYGMARYVLLLRFWMKRGNNSSKVKGSIMIGVDRVVDIGR